MINLRTSDNIPQLPLDHSKQQEHTQAAQEENTPEIRIGILKGDSNQPLKEMIVLDPLLVAKSAKATLFSNYYNSVIKVLELAKDFFEHVSLDALAQKMDKKIQKYQIKEAHENSHIWDKYVFGDDLLVTAKNIGTKSDLLQNKSAINELMKARKDQFIEDLRKAGVPIDVLTEASFDKIWNSEFRTISAEGVCMAASMHFISNYLMAKARDKNLDTNQFLVEKATEWEKGVPMEALVDQALILAIDINPEKKELMNEVIGMDVSLLPPVHRGETLPLKNTLMAKYIGMAPDIRETKDQGVRDKIGLYNGTYYTDTSEHLTRSRFNDLNDGAYFLSFLVEDGSHGISYIKNGQDSFLYDPNKGLIRCDKENPQKTLQNLLSTYTPFDPNNPNDYDLELTNYKLATP